MVKYLLNIGVHHRVAGRLSGAGGLFMECQSEEDTRVVTPMDLAVDRVRLKIDWKKKSMKTDYHCDDNDADAARDDEEDWEVLEICVRYADSARYRRPTETILRSAPPGASIISAAVGIVPVDLLVPMIARYQSLDSTIATDQFRRSLLTKTVHLATEAQQNYEEKGNSDNWSIVFKTLLDMGKHSKFKKAASSLQVKQDIHRQPLHIAAEYGLDWSNGIEPILQSDYDILLVQDTTTRLYPFMLAASGMELETDCRWVLQLLKRLLGRRYKVWGSANPWIDLYACLHYDNKDSDVGGDTRRIFDRIKRKKDEFWRDIMYGSKVAEEKDHVTILNSDSLLFHVREGTTTLSKDAAFSLVYSIAGLQTNLNTAFELLRQNPAIINQFVTSVNATADNNNIDNTRDPKSDRLIQKEKKRRKQRSRRRRLRNNNKKQIRI